MKIDYNKLPVLTNRFFFQFLRPKYMFTMLSNPVITISGSNQPIWLITESDCIFYLAARYLERGSERRMTNHRKCNLITSSKLFTTLPIYGGSLC
jgi:hypothetical protein